MLNLGLPTLLAVLVTGFLYPHVQLLLSIPSTTQLTVFLDCSGGQTILDPAGSLTPFSFIKGKSGGSIQWS